MNKLNVGKLFKDVRNIASKHSPEILTGLGIAGMITTTVLAVRATPKALELIEDKKEELGLEPTEKLTPAEVVKTTWKCYALPTVVCVVSTTCLIGSNSINAGRNAALATAANLSATALSDYKDKVIETFGEKKERTIREKVADEQLKREPLNKSTVIVTGNGSSRFYDDISKRRFTSDIEKIRRIVNDLNGAMLDGGDYTSLNDFYGELGLEPTVFGYDLGWNISKNGYKSGKIEVDFHARLDDDGQPSIVLDYTIAPVRGFDTY